MMDRIFLDANVLFSAAYKADSRLRQLWHMSDVQLVSSEYAVEEARRNLELAKPANISELQSLLGRIEILPDAPTRMRLQLELADKDKPILMVAVRVRATHLLTGDVQHFGHLFGQRVHGVLIQTPAQYFRYREAKKDRENHPGLGDSR